MDDTKLVMDETEKRRFQMLPKKLRLRIAALLKQPELIPPDGRRMRPLIRSAVKLYHVKVGGKTKACTLEEAASFVSCSAAYLEQELSKPLTKFHRSNVYRETTAEGPIVITKEQPK